MDRRKFLQQAATVLPCAVLVGQSNSPAQQNGYPVLVHAGEDRTGKEHGLGKSITTYKVLTSDSGGETFVMQHENHAKGGPPRHLHHVENEWFYVLEGRYLIEVGGERMELRAGDSVFAPRGVPHAWAHRDDSIGRMILVYTPAGQMEAFFAQPRTPGKYNQDAENYRKFGLELVGPPLTLD